MKSNFFFRKVNSNTFFISIDQFMNGFFNLVILIYISKFFGIEDIGKFTVLFSIILFLQLILFALIYEPLPLVDFKHKHSELFIILLATIIFKFIILISINNFLENLLNFKIELYFYFYYIVSSIKIFLKKIYNLEKKAYISFLLSFFSFTGTLSALYIFKVDLKNINQIFYLLIFFDFIFVVLAFKKYFLNLLSIGIIKILNTLNMVKNRFSNYFLFSGIRNFNGFFIIYLITTYIDYKTLGFYRISISILGLIHNIFQIFENVYPAKFSVMHRESLSKFINHYNKNFIFWTIIFIFLLAFLNFKIDMILNIFFSTEINNYKRLFFIISLNVLSDFLLIYLSIYIRIINKISLLKYLSLTQLIFLFIFGAFLVKSFLLIGLEITLLIYTLLSIMFCVYFYKKKLIQNYV